MAVAVSVVAILSQYFLPALYPSVIPVYQNLGARFLIGYLIPIVACFLLLGTGPLLRWRREMPRAVVWGLGWYGALSLLALVLGLIIIAFYAVFDPSALDLLNRPNPALVAAQSDPWFWVGISFAIGIFEELIFRGWIFGYWVQRGTDRWLVHATWTSALFAGVHLYYGFTYLAASPVAFVSLFLTGFAFAATVWTTKGNLVVVAALHGASDATAFLVLVNPTLGYALHYGLIGIGALVGLIAYLVLRPAPRAPPEMVFPLPPPAPSRPPEPPVAGGV